MFEGWLHETLANSLGRILDISKEQLRISLWSAWRTGLTLENVLLRLDAFEHLQLPVELLHGSIGRIQAQVPWRALRSPVVVELADVHLRVALRRDAEFEEGPAGERAWLAKQAELAAAELTALAAASAGDAGGTAAAAAAAGRQGGVLWSFMQHVVTMLVNRLQLTVSNVTVEFEDPQTGTRIGLQLATLRTRLPNEPEAASSFLRSEDAGVLTHASAAARGSIQKQFAVEGLALYWQPGISSSTGGSGSSRGSGSGGGQEGQPPQPDGSLPGTAAAAAGASPGRLTPRRVHARRLKPRRPPLQAYLLQPTDCDIQTTLQLSAPASAADGGGGIRMHAAMVVHHLPLSLSGAQAADMLLLSDRLAWVAARNKVAAYCPTGWRRPGPRTVPWRKVWRFAVNAVLYELRGERQGAVRWMDGPTRVAARKQYVALYRQFLERKHLEGASATARAAAAAEADEQLVPLERRLTVDEILTCRHVAQRVLDASLAAASGMGEAMLDAAAYSTQSRRRVQGLPASVMGASVAGGPPPSLAHSASLGHIPSARHTPPPPSIGDSSSGASYGAAPPAAAAPAGAGRRSGYLAWGVSKAAGLLRYLPYSGSEEARSGSGTAALPEPTEAELEELYQAVDFHPEEQQAAAAAASRAGGGAAAGLHLTVDCLLSKASLLLLDGGPASGAAAAGAQGAAAAVAAGASRGGGTGIAALELDQLSLQVQVQPNDLTASLRLSEVALHDLCSCPGLSSQLLSRGTPASVAAAAQAAAAATTPGSLARSPVLRLQYRSTPAAAEVPAGHAEHGGEPQPQLDVLVQPLLLRVRPLCLQRLLALVPPVVSESFYGCQLAALNGLAVEARCAIKARQVAALGPPVNLLVKVLDVEVQLPAAGPAEDAEGAPAALVLHTGPITLLSTDAAAGAPQRGHHALTAAEAAAHLSAAIKQRRLAARLGGGTPVGTSQDVAAAVAAVQSYLLYQQFELSIAELHAEASLPVLPGAAAAAAVAAADATPGSTASGGVRSSPFGVESSTGSVSGEGGSIAAGGSVFGRQWHPVLQRMRIGGALKLHRIAEDYALPQVVLGLQVDPLALSLSQPILLQLLDALDLPSSSAAQPEQPPAAAAPAEQPGAGPAEAHTSQVVASQPPASESAATAPVVIVDLQLKAFDLRFSGSSSSAAGAGGGSSGRSASPASAGRSAAASAVAGGLAALEARLSCGPTSVSMHSLLDGVAVKAGLARLLLHDFSPNPSPQPHLPPPVRGQPLPRIARQLAIDRLSVAHTASFGSSTGGSGSVAAGAGGAAAAGPHSSTQLDVWDLSIEGFAGETASFLGRLHERQASRLSVTVHDSPAATHAAVSASNMQLGHGLLLRFAALGQALAEEQEQAAAAAAASAAGGEDGGVSRSASAVALLTPEPSAEGAAVEAASSDLALPVGWEGSPEPAAVVQQAQAGAADGQQQQLAGDAAPLAASENVQPPDAEQQEQAAEPAGQAGEPSAAGQAAGELSGLYAASTGSRASMAAEEEPAEQHAVSPPRQPQLQEQAEEREEDSNGPLLQSLPAAAASGAASPAAAAAPAAASPAAHAALESAAPTAAAAATPSKPVFTSIQLSDIRLVLRYQPVLHPAGGAGGGSQHGPGGSGIPAAVHDFLSVHQDLLALDVPLLRLQLPLDPAGLAEAAAAAGSGTGSRVGAADGHSPLAGVLSSVAVSGSSSPLVGSSPRTGGSRSRGGSWRELSLAPFACSPGLAAEASSPSPVRQQHSQLQPPPPTEPQVLAEASRLTLSAAAVGYTRHAMLPVLQLPSLRLACSTSSGMSSSGGQTARHGRSASGASAATWPGGSTPAAVAPEAASAGVTAVAYQLEVSALDIGLHPSQLSMLTAALQICEHELALLNREPQEGSGTDSESAVTSLSGALERQQSTARTLAPAKQHQQHQQQAASPSPQQPAGPPRVGRRQSHDSAASGPAAAGDAGPASPQQAQQGAAGAAEAAGAEGSADDAIAAVPAPALPQWQVEAAVGCIGVSILGATASSTCLKMEWHGLRAAYAACGGASSVQAALPGQVGAMPSHRRGSSSSDGGSLQPAAWEAAHEVQLSWRQLALHVLEPRPAYQHPSLSPFAFAAAIVADAQRSRDAQGGLPGGSPINGASPRAFGGPGSVGFGPLEGPGGEVLYQRGRGGPLSTGGGAGVRRNLSAGLGAAETVASEDWHEASATLLGRTSGSSAAGGSRYFSLAESEFEDAASELEPGAQSPPAGQSPAPPAPLPLPLGGQQYSSHALVVLHGAHGPEGSSAPGSLSSDEMGSPASAAADNGGSIGGGEPATPPAAGAASEATPGDHRSPSFAGSASGAAGGCTTVTAQLHPGKQQASVSIDSIVLRLHLAGWEGAVQCLHTYAVLAQQAQRQYTAAAAARAASPLGGRPAPAKAASAGAVQLAAAAGEEGGSTAVRLHLRSLLVELLADEETEMHSSADSGSWGADETLVPAAALQAELQLSAELAADGSSRVRLLLPGLLLSVGAVSPAAAAAPPPALLGLPLGDALMGLHHLELSLVSQQQQRQLQPAATTAEGSVLVGAARQVSVGATLVQASLWAHPRNLCAAAALAGHAQALAASLAAHLPLQGDIETVASAVQAEAAAGEGEEGGPGPLQLTFKLNVQKAAVLLSLLTREDDSAPAGQHRLLPEPTPLLELAAAAVSADVHDLGSGVLEGTLKSELQVAAFSGIKLGWEPLLEPWRCRLQFAAPSGAPSAQQQHQRLSLSSIQGLELTVTQTALEAAALAGGALVAAAAVAEDPSLLEAQLAAAGNSAAYSAAYWLHNQTGTTLEVWLAANEEPQAGSSSPGGSPGSSCGGSSSASPRYTSAGSVSGVSQGPWLPAGRPELVVRPGGRAALPVVAASSAQQHGLHVGRPSATQGLLLPHLPGGRGQQFSLGHSASSSRLLACLDSAPHLRHGQRHSAATLEGSSSGLAAAAAALQTRPLLYFRLAEQSDVSGPLHLDRGCFEGCPVCPGVLCDMSEARHGGYTLALHSGVRLRNTTQLPLDIGVQTPMGLVMEPQALGTLRPGAAMWLPALRAHSGLLCIRPSAASAPALSAQSVLPPAPPPAPPSLSSGRRSAGERLQTAATWQPGSTTGSGGSRIPSLASDSLAAAAALMAGSQGAALPLPAQRMPSSPLLYSTTGLASPQRGSLETYEARQQHAPGASGAATPPWQQNPYEWSVAVSLQTLLRQAAGAEAAASGGRGPALERSSGSKKLTCEATSEHQLPVLLCMGASRLAGSDVGGTTTNGTSSSGRDAAIGGSGSGAAGPTTPSGPLGASGLSAGGSWEVLLSAPLVLHNALPVPVDVSLVAYGQPHRLALQPNQQAALHAVDASAVDHIVLRVLGYHPTRPFTPAPLPALASLGDSGSGGGRQVVAPDTELLLQEMGHGQSQVQAFVRHSMDVATGSHTLLFGCALWVFNCTGVPVALREVAPTEGVFGEAADRDGLQAMLGDEVPESWLPPLELPGQPPGSAGTLVKSPSQSPLHARLAAPPSGLRSVSREGMHSVLSTPTSAAPSVLGVSRGTSTADLQGLSEILDARSTTTADSRQVLGLKRTASRARGIADSMEGGPAFEMPSRWPSMQGGLRSHRPHRLRLQIRATQCQAPPGRTYWSEGVELDAMGGAAVVAVPSPLLPPTAAIPAARASYQMSVTASQVPGSGGALALYLLPRFLLINALDVPIQYKQQGTQHERELAAGASRALRWADVLRPLRLCVRIQEAGWMWSGGFELDTPGDMFIKIRHRDRGVTMLVRVDVAASAASGVLRCVLSHHPAGFAPYRIDNCSLETLHARQYRVREQQDVLRPYCSLNYAWDEPAQPHRLVLELPGSRTLGTFNLDQVGQDVTLSVPAKRGEPQRRLRVLVRTEGPTRVLTVLDTERHSFASYEEMAAAAAALAPAPSSLLARLQQAAAAVASSSGDGASASGKLRPWDGWGLPGRGGQQSGDGSASKLPGVLWEVSAELASLGVSLVGPTREMAYLRAGGVRAQLAGTAAHLVLNLELRTLQLDNPSPWVSLPVTLMVPAPISKLTSTVAAAVELHRKPAIVARLALWQRRPAGVVCVEQADVQLAPVAVYVEQQHAMQLAEFLGGLAASTEAAAAAAAASSSASTRPAARSRIAAAAAAAGGEGSAAGALSSSRAASEVSFHASGPSGVAVGGMAATLVPPLQLNAAGLGAVATPVGARLPGLPPDLEALLSGQGSALLAPAEQKVYIDLLRIGTLELTLSFTPAPYLPDSDQMQRLQRILSLADVEDARLRLAALELRNPLMGAPALAQALQRHYMRSLLPQLPQVVGSASFFGDPVRLFHHLGLGVWSLVASPAAGLVESARQRGPWQFLSGIASGTRGLFQNWMFALSNAATKGSTAARKMLTALGLDRLHPGQQPPLDLRGPGSPWPTTSGASFRRRLSLQRWDSQVAAGAAAARAAAQAARRSRDASGGEPGSTTAVVFSPREVLLEGTQEGGGDGGLLGALLLGVAGLAREPIRGLDEGGLVGLLGGIRRGAIGVVVLPLASLLEMLASTADSIRRAVAGSSNVGWVRPPRFVHPARPLAPYSYSEAMGRWLLTELERASLARHLRRQPLAAPPPGGGAAAAGLAAALAQREAAPHRYGEYVMAMPLAERSSFVVVTTKRVMFVHAREPMWVPEVRWSASLADLELVVARGPRLSLLALQPQRRHIVRSAAMLPRSLADALRTPRPNFCSTAVECESSASAEQLADSLRQLVAALPPWATFIGTCQVLGHLSD